MSYRDDVHDVSHGSGMTSPPPSLSGFFLDGLFSGIGAGAFARGTICGGGKVTDD